MRIMTTLAATEGGLTDVKVKMLHHIFSQMGGEAMDREAIRDLFPKAVSDDIADCYQRGTLFSIYDSKVPFPYVATTDNREFDNAHRVAWTFRSMLIAP